MFKSSSLHVIQVSVWQTALHVGQAGKEDSVILMMVVQIMYWAWSQEVMLLLLIQEKMGQETDIKV